MLHVKSTHVLLELETDNDANVEDHSHKNMRNNEKANIDALKKLYWKIEFEIWNKSWKKQIMCRISIIILWKYNKPDWSERMFHYTNLKKEEKRCGSMQNMQMQRKKMKYG